MVICPGSFRVLSFFTRRIIIFVSSFYPPPSVEFHLVAWFFFFSNHVRIGMCCLLWEGRLCCCFTGIAPTKRTIDRCSAASRGQANPPAPREFHEIFFPYRQSAHGTKVEAGGLGVVGGEGYNHTRALGQGQGP